MASLHKQPGKPNWFCAYTDASGKRHFKSTGTPDKEEAETVCATLARAVSLTRNGKLTQQRARKILTNALSEIMESGGEELQQNPVDKFATKWLADIQGRITPSTYSSYAAIIKRFTAFLGEDSKMSIGEIEIDQIRDYRDEIQKQFGTGTVNNHLKMLRKMFESAQEEDLIDRNPAKLVKNLRRTDKQERRPFTDEEIRAVLGVIQGEWRTAFLLGLYTGLRLGDVKALTWDQVSLRKGEISLATKKTGRTVIVPIATALGTHLSKLSKQKGSVGLFSRSFAGKEVKNLSNEFHSILVNAGLVEKRNYKEYRPEGKRRKYAGLSFHCLRHTTTSMLKNAGVSEAIAGDIVGHDSEAMTRNYTKIDSKAKREAMSRLPDVAEW